MSGSTAQSSQPQLPAGLNEDVSTIAGPFLYGGMASAALVGCLVIQSAFYFARASGDRWQYKLAVLALLCSSFADMGATLYLQQFVFLASFGNPEALHMWPAAVFVPLGTPIWSALCSQALYGWRLYTLARNRWIGAALVLLLAANVASGVVAIIVEAHGGAPVPLNENDTLLFAMFVPIEFVKRSFNRTVLVNEIFLAVTAATDLLLTCFLTVLLLMRRRKTNDVSRETNSLVWRVISLSVTTGAITALYSIAVAVIVLATVQSNNLYYGFVLPLSSVYGNVCVASLNFRRSMGPGHKGPSTSRSGSHTLATSPSVDKLRMRVDVLPSHEKYAFPPQRTFSQSQSEGTAVSRPDTGKSEFAWVSRQGTMRSLSNAIPLSNAIQVHSSFEQRVDARSPEAEGGGLPTLGYFTPHAGGADVERSYSQRSQKSYFDDAEQGYGRAQVHAPFPGSTSPREAYQQRSPGRAF